jgi:hypothetical protein
VNMLHSMYNLVPKIFYDSVIIIYMTSWANYLENTLVTKSDNTQR